MDFDLCVTCPALPESAACLSCTLYMDDGFDDDKERPFENIDIDGCVIGVRENNVLRGSESWSEEDDVENNQYLAYVSSL